MSTTDTIGNYLYDMINNNAYHYINREKGRQLRHFIVSQLEKLLSKTPFGKATLIILIRSIHIAGPFVLLLMLSISKFRFIADAVLLVLFLIPCVFIALGGCLLTSLEKRITDEDFTVIDPLLEWNNMELSVKNRIKMNYLACLYYLVIGLVIYGIRFYV